jgi:ribosomal protein L11
MDHSKEKEELLDAAAQASLRETEEKAKLQGELEAKQDLVAKVERDRMQLASKMEQAMRSVSGTSPLTRPASVTVQNARCSPLPFF